MAQVRQLTPKQEDRRHRILSAARELVADQGYEGMVMSQVAERAGVSPTTLYNLYNTKDELVLAALRDLLVENTLKIEQESIGPGWKQIVRRVHNGGLQSQSAPAYAEAITHSLLRANPGDALVEMLLTTLSQVYLESLIAMSERNEIKPGVDINELSASLVGVYWSSFMLWNKGVIRLQEIDHRVEMNILSMLFASTQGQAHIDIETELELVINRG